MGKVRPFTGLAGLAVWAAQFGDTSTLDIVDTPDLADGAVSTDKIADAAVDTDQLATDAVETAKIATNAVTTNEIATDGVETSNLKDNAATKISYAEDASPPSVTTTSTAMVSVTHTNTTVNNIIKEGFLMMSSDIDETIQIVLSVSPGVALIFEHFITGSSNKQLVPIREIAKDVLGDLGTSFSVKVKHLNGSANVVCHFASITVTEFKK